MIITNVLPKPATADDLLGYIADAVFEYGNSKTSAMKSAANAYLVWYHGESENAEPDMRKWLNEQVKKRNEKIDEHNAKIESDRRRAKELAEGKINDELAEDEKARLTALQNRKPHEWAQAKQVKIDVREGGSRFTVIVKFVFGFVKPSEASLVSRYAKVLEYIEQNKDKLAGVFTVDAIVELLNDAGGFEAALDKVRNPESDDEDKVRAATLTRIMEAVNAVEGGEEIAFKAKYEQKGYVFLLGRPSANGVKLCGELAINDNEAEALFFKVDEGIIGSAEPAVDFMARTVSIGELVREGRDSNIVDTAVTGKKFKVTRTYSLSELGGKTQMVVSARYTEASVVVHAVPKDNVIIGGVEPEQMALLDAASAAEMTKLFHDPARRLLMSVQTEQGDVDVPVRWNVITHLDGESTVKKFEWKTMFKEAHCPVDKRHFDPKCSITLGQQQVRELYDTYLRDWGKNKTDDQKVNKALTIMFDGVMLTVGHEVYGQNSITIGGKQGSPVSLEMRPRDIVDLFRKLIDLNVQDACLHGDADGLLAVSWEDEVGDYCVYIPSVEKRGGLNKTCLGYMKPKK